MPKIMPTNFPPRRPSGYVRYGLVAVILLLVFYSFSDSSSRPRGPPGTAFTRPIPDSKSNSNAFPHDAANTRPVKSRPKPGPGGPVSDDKSGALDPLADTKPKTDPFADKPSIDKVKIPDSGDGRPKDTDPVKVDPYMGEDRIHTNPDQFSGQDRIKDSSKSSGSSKDSSKNQPWIDPDTPVAGGPDHAHPIDKLIFDAQNTFAELVSKESKSVSEAAQAYRKRRGRHPPPGFDKWYEFARDHNALVVEDFFDQIYHDLEPFWGMSPALLRKEASTFEMTINVRNGAASSGSDWFWTTIWLDLIKTIERHLPDMDIALNAMDEPRLVVPWEEINDRLATANKARKLHPAKDVTSELHKLPPPGQVEPSVQPQQKVFEDTRPYWKIARRGCAPDSSARTAPLQESFAKPPVIDNIAAEPHMYQGYVSNYSLSTEICHQPDLQGLEGILIEPLSVSATKTLFPMFGGSKLAVNNEILLPAPMYWNEEERFTGGDDHGVSWPAKVDSVIWRGVATGGKNREDNWRGFQRHRFVAMNNGTSISLAETGQAKPENFVLPDKEYKLPAQKDKRVGDWVSEWSDVSFIDLMCFPPMDDGSCQYTDPYFERTMGLKMSEQFDSKIVPDIDGNSFSGRYLGFLRSTSLPVKATIWREWHDSRLVAWKHFVPMDSRFSDWYGIINYFLGYGAEGAHDKAAEKIANEGKEWAEKVLRKDDMQIYVLRLLLEYARVSDDNRETVGWVKDVLDNPALEQTWSDWW